MKKIFITLLLILLSKVTVYANEVTIYYNNEVLAYTGYINQNNYVYIPLVLFSQITDSTLNWTPENGEVLMTTPVSIYKETGNYEVELRTWIGQDVYYSRGIDPDTKKVKVYMYGGNFRDNVILINDRTMIPICKNETSELSNVLDLPILADYDGKGELYLSDYMEPTVEERYKLLEISPEQWIASFDDNQNVEFNITWENGESLATDMYISIYDSYGNLITPTMPWILKDVQEFSIYKVDGVTIMFRDIRCILFDKQELNNLITG